MRVRLVILVLVGPDRAVDSVASQSAGVRHLLARGKVDGVACASRCGNRCNADLGILALLWCFLEVDCRIDRVVGECARRRHVLARRKLDRVAQTSGSRNGVNELALLGARRGRHGECARNRLI